MKINETTPFCRIVIDFLYNLLAKNILKEFESFFKFSSLIICELLNDINMVIRVRIKPDMVKPIAPISEAKLELKSLDGIIIRHFSFK